MLVRKTLVVHLSVPVLALTMSLAVTAAPSAGRSADRAPLQQAQQEERSQFVITLQGVRIGAEQVTISRAPGSIKVSMTGQIGPPVDLQTTKFELTYASDWQPQQLSIEGTLRNEMLYIGTTFGLTTASNDLVQGAKRGGVTHQITPRAVVLPPNFFGAYEILAARLPAFPVGSRVPIYAAPEGEVSMTINRVSARRIVTSLGAAELQEYDLTLNRPGLPMSVHVLVDAKGKLARVIYRDLAYAAIREEFASVMARDVRVHHAGDEDTFIPASGFSLAATMTRPKNAAARAPAVILVGGPGRQDRDETLYGVPIFGQLAGHLSDAGFFVVRYDKRGVGQSGGRQEHAGLADYGDDVIGIVAWLRKRKDVDPDRISIVTHGEGGAVGLTAASREKRIRAVAMLAAPGLRGRDVVLEQQRLALSRRNEPPAEREAKIALQQRVMDAVVTGKGWETIPPDIRRQSDTPWFKSWLLFDPAVTLSKVSQPLFLLHGETDFRVPPSNGERLAQLSTARKNSPATHTTRVVVPGVGHLLIAAKPDDLEEYDATGTQAISTDVVTPLIAWLRTTLK